MAPATASESGAPPHGAHAAPVEQAASAMLIKNAANHSNRTASARYPKTEEQQTTACQLNQQHLLKSKPLQANLQQQTVHLKPQNSNLISFKICLMPFEIQKMRNEIPQTRFNLMQTRCDFQKMRFEQTQMSFEIQKMRFEIANLRFETATLQLKI